MNSRTFPPMRRAHFNLIARSIATMRNTVHKRSIILTLADQLGPTNNNFQREKFMQSCGYVPPKKKPTKKS